MKSTRNLHVSSGIVCLPFYSFPSRRFTLAAAQETDGIIHLANSPEPATESGGETFFLHLGNVSIELYHEAVLECEKVRS